MIINGSEECGKSELSLFQVPNTQIAIEESFFDEIYPHPNYQHGTIQFEIKGDNETYVDLSECELWMTLALCKKGTETPLTTLPNVSIVNNLMHSIFSQCQIAVNNIEIENSNSNYPYRSYLKNLLCYNSEDKNTWLTQELFLMDTAGSFDVVHKEAGKITKKKDDGTDEEVTLTEGDLNAGMIKRTKRFEKNPVQVCGVINADFFACNRMLMPQVSVQIKLTRADPQFYLLSSDSNALNAVVVVQEAFMRVRRNRVNQNIFADHLLQLDRESAKYPLDRTLCKTMCVPFASSVATLPNLHSGVLPSRLTVCFVETEAYTGSYNKNPFNFQTFGINFLRLKAGSRVIPYSNGIRMRYEKDQYLQAYSTLFRDLHGGPMAITYEEYAKGNTIYCFDLSPDRCHSEHFSLIKEGQLDLEIFLDSPQRKSITAIILLEFSNILEISKQNQVQLDYQI